MSIYFGFKFGYIVGLFWQWFFVTFSLFFYALGKLLADVLHFGFYIALFHDCSFLMMNNAYK
ncbi:MAG TPA: hypothetical protein DCL86_14095 [Bacteroidales bacterium]|nr:hypothetical protein [Bacteroidales bacterium]